MNCKCPYCPKAKLKELESRIEALEKNKMEWIEKPTVEHAQQIPFCGAVSTPYSPQCRLCSDLLRSK